MRTDHDFVCVLVSVKKISISNIQTKENLFIGIILICGIFHKFLYFSQFISVTQFFKTLNTLT